MACCYLHAVHGRRRGAISRRLAAGVAGAALLPAVLTAGGAAVAERVDEVTGPFAPYVLRPTAYGVDATRTLVDVPPRLAVIDAGRLRSHVATLAFDRSTRAGAERAGDLVATMLEASGLDPVQSPVPGDAPNVFAEVPGHDCPAKVVVIGAHLDTMPGSPGADDNATGLAAIVEIADVVGRAGLPVTVRFAAFSGEEDGQIGSTAMAEDLARNHTDVAAMLSLDMIGYTSTAIDPLSGTPSDYLAMAAVPGSDLLARTWGAAARTYVPELPAAALVVPPRAFPGVLRSDHRSFYRVGYPVLGVSDVGPIRNPNYHRPTDTPDTLDYPFLTASTRAIAAGLITFASVDEDRDGVADVCVRPSHTRRPDTTTTTGPAAPSSTLPPATSLAATTSTAPTASPDPPSPAVHRNPAAAVAATPRRAAPTYAG